MKATSSIPNRYYGMVLLLVISLLLAGCGSPKDQVSSLATEYVQALYNLDYSQYAGNELEPYLALDTLDVYQKEREARTAQIKAEKITTQVESSSVEVKEILTPNNLDLEKSTEAIVDVTFHLQKDGQTVPVAIQLKLTKTSLTKYDGWRVYSSGEPMLI